MGPGASQMDTLLLSQDSTFQGTTIPQNPKQSIFNCASDGPDVDTSQTVENSVTKINGDPLSQF